jgi:hypothetical protein
MLFAKNIIDAQVSRESQDLPYKFRVMSSGRFQYGEQVELGIDRS